MLGFFERTDWQLVAYLHQTECGLKSSKCTELRAEYAACCVCILKSICQDVFSAWNIPPEHPLISRSDKLTY